MNYTVKCIFILMMCITIPGYAHSNFDETPIHTGVELIEWCKQQVERVYLPLDKIPRNWRESVITEGNYFKAKLVFRIEGEDYLAECRVRVGAARHYAAFLQLGKRND